MSPSPSPNPLSDLRELLTYPFMVDALAAGTILAVLAGAIGWYVVLRRQAFASHTLSVMAFPGASGAALLGLPVALGYYVACTAAAAVIGRAGRSAQGESAAIGTVQSVGLAAGFLFLTLNAALLDEPEALLFGTFLGITPGQVLELLIVALVVLSALAALGRPLLFASVDPDGARARGLPVAWLDTGFLVLLGLAIAAVSQLTGALLVFALLIAPPAAARRLTLRPLAGLALSIGFGLMIVWLALAIAYFSIYPLGFYVTSLALAVWLLARWLGSGRGGRRGGGAQAAHGALR